MMRTHKYKHYLVQRLVLICVIISISTGGNAQDSNRQHQENSPSDLNDSDSVRFMFSSHPYGNVLVGDYDNDEDYDVLLLSGFRELLPGKLIENNEHAFEVHDLTIADVYGSGRGQAWADFDNDNDLDLIMTGTSSLGRPVSKIYSNDGNGGYTELSATFDHVFESAVASGDLDNDGDRDLIISGLLIDGHPITKIYYNLGAGDFVESNTKLEGLSSGSILVCDLDNDLDNDIVLNGYDRVLKKKSIVIRNDNNDLYTAFADLLPGIGWGMWKAAGLNRDNRLDLLAVDGATDKLIISVQSKNLQFNTYQISSLTSTSRLDVTDYDNDGDVDVALSSGIVLENNTVDFSDIKFRTDKMLAEMSSHGDVVWVDWFNDYSNDLFCFSSDSGGAILVENLLSDNRPSFPTNLNASTKDGTTVLEWDRATDMNTNILNLSYNLRVGSTPGGCEIISPLSDSSGFHKIMDMGNCSLNSSWRINNLPPGEYFWSVQTIDQGMHGSPFAKEQSFVIQHDYSFQALSIDSTDEVDYLLPADIDNDGDFDLICTTETLMEDGSTDRLGGVLRNAGDSIFLFEDMGFLGDSLQLSQLAVHDYNNDGFLDIAMSLRSDVDSSLSIPFLRISKSINGERFENTDYSNISLECKDIRWIDFDNDGDQDLCLIGFAQDSLCKIALYKNDQLHTFSLFQELHFPYLKAIEAVINDFNRDSRMDLLVWGEYLPDSGMDNSKSYAQFYTASALGWSHSQGFTIPEIRGSLDISDINKDGFVDALGYGSPNEYEFDLHVNINDQGTGLFLTDPGIPGINGHGFAKSGDYNLDNLTDIYVYQEYPDQKISYLKLYLGAGSDFIEKPLSVEGSASFDSLTEINSFHMLDLDGDFDLDLALTGKYNGKPHAGLYFQKHTTNPELAIPVPEQLEQSPKEHGVVLSWENSEDGAFYYNVRVGTTPGGVEIVSPLSDADSGLLRIHTLGNAECNTTFYLDSLDERTYYWSVQTITNNGVGGLWSIEDSFSVGEIVQDFEVVGTCSGEQVSFYDRSVGPVTNWRWEFGDGFVSQEEDPVHAYSQPGDYKVKLQTHYNEFTYTWTKDIRINKGIEVDFEFEQVEVGRDVPFTNLTDTAGVNVKTWIWDFGDGSICNEYDPVSHYYESQRIYTVKLSAYAFNGCADSISREVEMCNERLAKPEIYAIGEVVWYLACSNDTAGVYRWYYDGELIPGATEYIYVAGDKMGEYQVEISEYGNCPTRSDVVSIPDLGTGIGQEEKFRKLEIYPNPSTGIFTVDLNSSMQEEVILDVYSGQGAKVFSRMIPEGSSHASAQVDLSGLKPGIYLIHVIVGENRTSRKIILE